MGRVIVGRVIVGRVIVGRVIVGRVNGYPAGWVSSSSPSLSPYLGPRPPLICPCPDFFSLEKMLALAILILMSRREVSTHSRYTKLATISIGSPALEIRV